MKRLSIFAFVFLLACQTSGSGVGPDGRLSTEEDFAPIIGQRLIFGDSDFVTINADGTFSGNFSGADTRGTWELRDGYWCRTLSAGPCGAQPEDCQLFVRSGNILTITRDRGNGRSFEYVIG